MNKSANLANQNNQGETALMLAVKTRVKETLRKPSENTLAIVSALSEADIDKHTINHPDCNGDTPLDVAVRGADLEIVSILIKHVEKVSELEKYVALARELGNREILSSIQTHVNNSLIAATSDGNIELVRDLIRLGAEVKTKNDRDETALFVAVKMENVVIVSDLIEADKEGTLHMPDCDGNTPLIEAARRGNSAICKLLINKWVNLSDQNNSRETALMVAVQTGNIEIV